MADTYNALMEAIIDALQGAAGVTALVSTRIYSDAPQNVTFPYVVVSISSGDFSTATFSGQDHTVQLNIYSRVKSPSQVGAIKAACYDVLHRTESTFTLDVGTLSILQFDGVSEVFKDDDGVTWEGVMRFRAVVT